MFEFLAECDPCHIDTVLINLNSGEVADESVNAFQAQAIGESLIQGIAGTSAFDYKFRNKDMAIIIKTNASVNIEDSVEEDDPWLFFQRLIVSIQPEEINNAFNYEFCISTKGSKHIRRSKGRLGRKIVPSIHNAPTVKKVDFLMHKHNKQAFLEMFGTQLSVSGISVMHSDGDADVDIVSSARTVTNTCPVTLLGKDTDLLIPLLWHVNPSLHHPVHLHSNFRKTAVYIKKSKQLIVMS